MATLLNLLSTVDNPRCEDGVIDLGVNRVEVHASEGALRVVIRGRERLEKVASVVVRAVLCLGCRSCEVWCPTRAVRVVGRAPQVDASRCTKCGLCSTVCPLTEYLLRTALVKLARGG